MNTSHKDSTKNHYGTTKISKAQISPSRASFVIDITPKRITE